MRMTFASRLRYILAPLLAVPILFLGNYQVKAADLTNRRLITESSIISVVNIHTFSFNVISGTDIGSIDFEYCSNSPLDQEACTPPTGFDISAATLDSETGETGFSIHGNTTANRMVLSRAVATPTPGPVEYVFSNVTNPDTVGSHYVRIHTYITDDGTGPNTDRGGLAFTMNEQVNVSAFVPPVLRFCVAVTIPGADCTSAAGSNIDFGVLSENATSFGTTQMMAATNGFGGYNITVTGTTMTSGNNIITPLATRTSSSQGVQQFGMNLANNTNPNVGSPVTGVGTGSATLDYSIPNQYKFVSGDVVASSPLSTDYNKYTTSYITNIAPNQPAGYYSTTLTYIAFASF